MSKLALDVSLSKNNRKTTIFCSKTFIYKCKTILITSFLYYDAYVIIIFLHTWTYFQYDFNFLQSVFKALCICSTLIVGRKMMTIMHIIYQTINCYLKPIDLGVNMKCTRWGFTLDPHSVMDRPFDHSVVWFYHLHFLEVNLVEIQRYQHKKCLYWHAISHNSSLFLTFNLHIQSRKNRSTVLV